MKRLAIVLIIAAATAATGSAQNAPVPDTMMMSTGMKVDFTTLEDAAMIAESGPAVLFFYAGWCPFCREAMAEIDSRTADLGNITIVVVDYDRERRLKRQFGVTYQHTFVQIDANGETVALWNGGGVDQILVNVK